MNSCIYVGQVRHRRFSPKLHSFRYKLFMMLLDLDELEQVFDKRWLWSSKNINLAWFRRQDHFGNPNIALADEVKRLVEQETGTRPQGPIRLLTHLRYFGYCFNPVSFYYCYDASDSYVETIVAEVNNTPWGERHCYVLGETDNYGGKLHKRYLLNKIFHVSPFMEMALQYDWRFGVPQNKLNVHMQNRKETESSPQKVFDATLTMERHEVTASNMAKILVQFPFMTGKVIASIYFQAFKIWLKRIPFYEHPKPTSKLCKTKEAPETAITR